VDSANRELSAMWGELAKANANDASSADVATADADIAAERREASAASAAAASAADEAAAAAKAEAAAAAATALAANKEISTLREDLALAEGATADLIADAALNAAAAAAAIEASNARAAAAESELSTARAALEMAGPDNSIAACHIIRIIRGPSFLLTTIHVVLRHPVASHNIPRKYVSCFDILRHPTTVCHTVASYDIRNLVRHPMTICHPITVYDAGSSIYAFIFEGGDCRRRRRRGRRRRTGGAWRNGRQGRVE
jgi:hypothetical protein